MSKLKSGYKFLPDIATADLAFEAYGKDYNDLFENAGLALESAQIDLKTIEARRVREIKLEADSLENSLFAFLEELVYLKDAENLLFNRIKCTVEEVGSKKWEVRCKLSGEKIDPKKHRLGVDVKAVTKHFFRIEKLRNATFRCQVVLDV